MCERESQNKNRLFENIVLEKIYLSTKEMIYNRLKRITYWELNCLYSALILLVKYEQVEWSQDM